MQFRIDTKPVNIEVTGDNPLTVDTEGSLPPAEFGKLYIFQLAASGGTAPYSWRYYQNPEIGLALAEDGLITGTPTAVGSHEMNVVVEDAAGASVRTALFIEISSVSGTDLLRDKPSLVFNAAATSGDGSPSTRRFRRRPRGCSRRAT